MFLPENAGAAASADKERKEGFQRIENWSMEIIPAAIRDDAISRGLDPKASVSLVIVE